MWEKELRVGKERRGNEGEGGKKGGSRIIRGNGGGGSGMGI